MVFPVETEDRTMRNLLMLCQDYTRLIVEAFRKILAITDSLTKDEGTASGFEEAISTVLDESTKVRRTLIKELEEIGGVLSGREDFFRLVSTFGDIVDHVFSIGIRLAEAEKREWAIPEKASKGIQEISDIAFDTLLKLREAMMSLGFNSEKSVAFTKEIDELEKKLDSLYMQVEMKIITSEIDLPLLLMLKDVAMLIESLVDTVRDASDLIRIIAL